MKCDVCGRDAVGVCASSLGQAASYAYCKRCLLLDYVPWGDIVGAVFCVGRTNIASWARDIIERSLIFHGRTWEDVEREVREINLRFDKEISNDMRELWKEDDNDRNDRRDGGDIYVESEIKAS